MIKDADALSRELSSVLGANSEDQDIAGWLDTGYSPLNAMLTGDPDRGLPYGRIVEVFGPSGAGKTRLLLEFMLQAQKLGGVAGLNDHERAWNNAYAESQGLKMGLPHFIYKQPKTWEESNTVALKACETLRKSKLIDPLAPIVIGFDSVAAMIPQSVFEKGIDAYTMNDTTALARVASTTLKAVNAFAAEFNAIFVYLNQVRTKPGVVYGDPTTTPGGVAMEFYASIRLALGRKLEKDKATKEVTGQDTGIVTKKNRFSRPFQETSLMLDFPVTGGSVYDKADSMVTLLTEMGAIQKKGNYLLWDGKQLYHNDLVRRVKADGIYPTLDAMFKDEFKKRQAAALLAASNPAAGAAAAQAQADKDAAALVASLSSL